VQELDGCVGKELAGKFVSHPLIAQFTIREKIFERYLSVIRHTPKKDTLSSLKTS
jgi:hypothetical protein